VSPRGNNRCELLTGAAARALRVAPTGEINRPAATAAEKGTGERARLYLYVRKPTRDRNDHGFPIGGSARIKTSVPLRPRLRTESIVRARRLERREPRSN